jgi:hypothetical protein
VEAQQVRYFFLTGGDWQAMFVYKASIALVVPVDFRDHYTDTYPLSLVKGFEGELAELVDPL